MTDNSPAAPRGVLRQGASDEHNEHRRLLPREALAPFVAHFWWVRWWRAEPFVTETLPHPSVHLVFERRDGVERAEVAGVSTARFTRTLSGEGAVFGVKFRPAMFQALCPAPVSRLANRVAPIDEMVGDGDVMRRAVFAAPTFEAKIDAATAFLDPRLRPLAASVIALRDLVERMAVDRSLLRAEDAAAALGVDLRTLQRRFQTYVGASPKWVIQRYRLHEAAEQLKAPNAPPLAALAVALGYADQSHFARDFKAMVGRTPREFAAHEGRPPT